MTILDSRAISIVSVEDPLVRMPIAQAPTLVCWDINGGDLWQVREGMDFVLGLREFASGWK